jgi:hypothetical protein
MTPSERFDITVETHQAMQKDVITRPPRANTQGEVLGYAEGGYMIQTSSGVEIKPSRSTGNLAIGSLVTASSTVDVMPASPAIPYVQSDLVTKPTIEVGKVKFLSTLIAENGDQLWYVHGHVTEPQLAARIPAIHTSIFNQGNITNLGDGLNDWTVHIIRPRVGNADTVGSEYWKEVYNSDGIIEARSAYIGTIVEIGNYGFQPGASFNFPYGSCKFLWGAVEEPIYLSRFFRDTNVLPLALSTDNMFYLLTTGVDSAMFGNVQLGYTYKSVTETFQVPTVDQNNQPINTNFFYTHIVDKTLYSVPDFVNAYLENLAVVYTQIFSATSLVTSTSKVKVIPINIEVTPVAASYRPKGI